MMTAWTAAPGCRKVCAEQLDEARRRDEQAVVLRERADTILTAITAHESQIAKLHDELRHVIREYAHTNALKTSTVPAI